MMQVTPHHDTDSSSATTQLSQLPPALTAHILQFVPQRQRLTCCAVACSAWRAAAAQATVHIDCKLRLGAAAAALEAWLEQHGRRVESIEVAFVGHPWSRIPLQLPWARLSQVQSLSLTGIELPAINGSNGSAPAAGAGDGGSSGSGGQPSNTPLLPKLKQLQLSFCFMNRGDSLVQLANSTALTSLVVERGRLSLTVDGQSLTALCTLLQQLPRLVVLQLPFTIKLSRAAIKHVGGMRSLQHLQLHLARDACGDCLADLPSSLTRLQLWDYRERALKVAQPTLPPQLQHLTSLQQLQLDQCSLAPAVLASIPQLQHLQLQWCTLLPLDADGDGNSAAATAALLAALQQLTRLQHLQICGAQLDTAGPSPEQWAALTQLTNLHLVGYQQQPLPQGAAQHMFPAERQLRQLQQLTVQSTRQWYAAWCLDGPDLGSIISCCPQLHELNVDGTVRAGADVSALLRLPASCSSLSIGGVGFADAAASVVAQLTQLTRLSWERSPQLTDLGLQQLTALQGLSRLHVAHCLSISASMWAAAGVPGGCQPLDLVSTDTKGPVAQQLQAIVAASRRVLQPA